jgi:hypothetical protein
MSETNGLERIGSANMGLLESDYLVTSYYDTMVMVTCQSCLMVLGLAR